jgi:hypothetical protein
MLRFQLLVVTNTPALLWTPSLFAKIYLFYWPAQNKQKKKLLVQLFCMQAILPIFTRRPANTPIVPTYSNPSHEVAEATTLSNDCWLVPRFFSLLVCANLFSLSLRNSSAISCWTRVARQSCSPSWSFWHFDLRCFARSNGKLHIAVPSFSSVQVCLLQPNNWQICPIFVSCDFSNPKTISCQSINHSQLLATLQVHPNHAVALALLCECEDDSIVQHDLPGRLKLCGCDIDKFKHQLNCSPRNEFAIMCCFESICRLGESLHVREAGAWLATWAADTTIAHVPEIAALLQTDSAFAGSVAHLFHLCNPSIQHRKFPTFEF